MERCPPYADAPPAGIAPAAAPSPPAPARRPRRCTADYRWTQPKVLAFLEALSRCGKVAEAARAVGMSAWSAHRLRGRMGSARFDAAFEGARKSGIRARAEASRVRIALARSRWEGPSLADMAARERAREAAAQGVASLAQGAGFATQSATSSAQGVAQTAQGGGLHPQGAGFQRKVTENTPGPCNTCSMSPAMAHGGARA